MPGKYIASISRIRSASLTLTARKLGVHVHTIRYRLTKIEELTGLSLSSTEDRLTIELAFRILALTETDTPDNPGGPVAEVVGIGLA